MSIPTAKLLADQAELLSPQERVALISMLVESLGLQEEAGGLKAHMLIEDEVIKRSMDRHRRIVSGGEEFVFRYCTFEDLEPSAPLLRAAFLDCRFERCEWEQASFNGAVFVGTTFDSCVFFSVWFGNCLFVECAFVNCEFCEGADGATCSFEGGRWYACTKDNTTGLEVIP